MDKYTAYVDKQRQLILDAFHHIWANPETGYREWKTHKYLADAFEGLGYTLKLAGNIPGFTAEIDTGRPGPTVLVFGEMDGLLIPNHPDCDKQTGAVHACGHCCQTAALLGLAAALKEPGALDEMCGKIRLVAVPAEELIEMEYRKELYDQGIIHYYGGKPEFLRRGLLDGADLAFMIHTSEAGRVGSCPGGSNGLIAKTVTFQGVAAHAGAAPHQGVNALYAANLALNAINALRETFKDSSHIRVHPVITAGGESVNTVPDEVKLESYIRGATMAEIAAVNKKVNRAIAASAAALGAKVHIHDIPGYCPRKNGTDFMKVLEEAMQGIVDEVKCDPDNWSAGCSDMGDISSVMPAIHPFIGGAEGTAHGVDYRVVDPELACVDSAKVQLRMLKLLLEKDGAVAKQIVADYEPFFASYQDYFTFMDNLNMDKQTVDYSADGTVTLSYCNE